MNYSSVIFLMEEEIPIRAICVSYETNSGGKNLVKKTLDPDIKRGDYVLVETDTRWGATVCKVEAVDVEVDLDSDAYVGWIFGTADLEKLDRLKEMEKKMIDVVKEGERRKRKAELKASIDRVQHAALVSLVAPEKE